MQQRTLALIGMGLLLAALALAGVTAALAAGPSLVGRPGGSTGGMMGGWGGGGNGGTGPMSGMMGGMMSGMMANGLQSESPDAAEALARQAASTATIDRQSNTITYTTSQVQIVALASPDTGPDMTWNVDGLVNPTIIVPRGAEVTVTFFNADADTMHGWELTGSSPPYPYMPMMSVPVAFEGAFAMPVPEATAQSWYGRTAHFSAANTGSYEYLCPVAGHAQHGMFGKLVIP